MAVQPTNSDTSRKCGVVLTCFDNGRKRFKAIPVDASEASVDEIPSADVEGDRSAPELAPVSRHRRSAS